MSGGTSIGGRKGPSGGQREGGGARSRPASPKAPATIFGVHVGKLSISQAWDETKAVLTRDGKLIGAVALALFVLPGIVLDLVMPPAPAGQFPAPGPWMAVAAVAILISLTCQLAIIRLGMGPHLTVGDAIAHGARRLLPFVAAVLAWGAPLILVIAFLYASMAENSEKPSPAAALALI